MTSKHIYFLVALALFGFNETNAQLKIYYIRHAEGGHNVGKEWKMYSDIPEDKWPEYVGTKGVFTPKGKMQQASVSNKLKKYKFDFIAVSPMWRTKNTILPYLKKNNVKGEIWPELKELYNNYYIVSPDLVRPTVEILGKGKSIELTPEEAPYFTLREDGLNYFKLPKFPKDHSEPEAQNAASRVVIQGVLDQIKKRFGGTNKSILLVGHGSSGKGVLRMLTKKELKTITGITNTGVWMVEENAKGEFKLKIYNDVEIETYCE